MSNHPGLGPGEYARLALALGLVVRSDLSPLERKRALPSWLCTEMLATADARRRLKWWAEDLGGKLTLDDDTPETRGQIIKDIAIVAARSVEQETREILRRLPPPLLVHLKFNGVIKATGGGMGGFAGGIVPHAEAVELGEVVVHRDDRATPEQYAALLAHETCHLFLEPLPTVCPLPGSDRLVAMLATTEAQREALADNRMRLVGCASMFGRADWIRQRTAEVETRAARLAHRLGFTGHGADVEDSEAQARERTLEEARHATAQLALEGVKP